MIKIESLFLTYSTLVRIMASGKFAGPTALGVLDPV